MSRFWIFLIFFLPLVKVQAFELDDYLVAVNNKCPSINQLIVKKSMIELKRDRNCISTFTTILLRDCPHIDCNTLKSLYDIGGGAKPGSVIGR